MFFLNKKGQASLDYILTLAVFFTFIALLMPYFLNFYHSSMFYFDSIEASNFSQNFHSKVEKLTLLGNDSEFEIEANPLEEWVFEIQKNKLIIIIKSSFLKKEKILPTVLNQNFFSEKRVMKKKTKILLLKKNNHIVLQFK